MRKSKKQLAIAAAACAMIGVMAIGGTMAYLTDQESATNTFTIGKVKIALEEPNYPGNESDQVKDLVPNEVVKKDPQVQNTGINDAIIYLKVEVPKANVTVVADDGTCSDKKVQEIFTLKNLKTSDDGTWMEIRKDDSATDKCVYVFAYKAKLTKDTTTTPLFDEVQLKNVIEQEIDTTTQNIKINAYAIQADNILDVDTTTLDQTTLGKVYDIYVNQSGDKQAGSDAGDNKGDSKDDQKSNTAVLLDGKSLNAQMKTLAGDSSPSYSSYNTSVQAIQHSDTEPSEEVKTNVNSLVSTEDSEKPIYMWFENGVIKWWSEAATVNAGTDLSYLCNWMSNLTDISGFADLDTSNVTNMDSLFLRCGKLTDLSGISGWNTRNLNNLQSAFRSTAVTNLNPISEWDVSNVTNMSGIFAGSSVANLTGLEKWNTSNVADMSSAFYNCKIKNVDPIAKWDTSHVENMEYMFYWSRYLTNLDGLANWDTGNVENMSCMFSGGDVYDMTIADLSPLANWDTSNVTNTFEMFKRCGAITSLTPLKNWNTGNITDTRYMFEKCKGITDLTPLSKWNTGNVIDMSWMFIGCTGLTNLSGLSDWDTGNVVDMGCMFNNCSGLTNASAINDWNIAKVTSFGSMFNGCSTHPVFSKRTGAWYKGTFTPTT